jgi:hypothetical protein
MADVIAALLVTLQLLFGVVGSHAVVEEAVPAAVPMGIAAGDTSCAEWVLQPTGQWSCPANVWRVRMAPTFNFSDQGAADEQDRANRHTALALTTLVHELAHVYDAMDDGEFNGSRGHPRPDDFIEASRLTGGREPWEPTPWYCWAAGADSHGTLDAPPTDRARGEWYACEVARTGRLQ